MVGASCFTDALSALQLFGAQAGLSASEIRGVLFTEDFIGRIEASLSRRVVTSSGALVQAPSRRRARGVVESEANAFRQMLASKARSCAATWSFETCTGELIEGVWSAQEKHDLLLLGYGTINRRRGRIVLVAKPNGASEASAALAEGLGKRLHTEVVSLPIDSESPPENQVRGATPTLPALLSQLNRMNAEVVILDIPSPQSVSRDLLRAIYSTARCPVLVLKSAD